MPFDIKAFLDEQLFGKLLAGWAHKLTLVTFLMSARGDDVDLVYVLLGSAEFPEDFVGLLEHGAKIDHFRNPVHVSNSTFFGTDGLPTLARSFVSGRVVLNVTPRLVAEIRQVAASLVETSKIAGATYDLAKKRLRVDPVELAAKYGASS